MPWLPLVLALAQTDDSFSVDVPILHRRPSKIAKIMNGLGDGKVFLLPDDERSTLRLVGSKADVTAVKDSVRLFDIEARKVRLAIRLENPIDHADWKGSIEVRNNEVWSGEDGATGIRLRLSPRVNDDGTCTVMVESKATDGNKLQTILRLKRQKEQTLELPSLPFRPTGGPGTPAKVSLRFLGA